MEKLKADLAVTRSPRPPPRKRRERRELPGCVFFCERAENEQTNPFHGGLGQNGDVKLCSSNKVNENMPNSFSLVRRCDGFLAAGQRMGIPFASEAPSGHSPLIRYWALLAHLQRCVQQMSPCSGPVLSGSMKILF